MRMKELVEKWYIVNDGSRSLLESIVVPEVEKATKDWVKSAKPDFVLIGGIALAYHHIPRMTMDVDTLYLTREQIPDRVDGFKRTRPGAFQHNQTHVEVEVLAGQAINMPQEIVQKVFDTAISVNGVKIASKSGLVALKLLAQRTGAKGRQDQADIINLLASGGVNIDEYAPYMSAEVATLYKELEQEVREP